nr:MAG TPA: hypothetical protein [Bacteriophage sp.]
MEFTSKKVRCWVMWTLILQVVNLRYLKILMVSVLLATMRQIQNLLA